MQAEIHAGKDASERKKFTERDKHPKTKTEVALDTKDNLKTNSQPRLWWQLFSEGYSELGVVV
jgi:hypothetical protein